VHQLLLLILQIAVILVAARTVGYAFRAIRQPQVVGEMAAGILLGPSFLGWVAPELSLSLFPAASLVHVQTVSQIGLLIFMFLVGVEFDPALLKGRGHAALITSHVSIVAPFFLGSILALYLYPQLSDASVTFTGFALFMGAAMSVTAFPVLARILVERNLMRTRVGAVAIACAAVDDVSAWSILAVVIAIVRAHAVDTPLWLTLVGTAAYSALMVFGVRRALRWFERRYHNVGHLTQDMMGVVLLLLLASAWTTEWLGIHALFGAFFVGAVMPKDRGLVRELTDKLEDITIVFLLPLFFAMAGLKTQIGLVSGIEMWAFFGLIMLVAVVGKFGGSTLSARISGLTWREAGALGILMNTRGLMELVILTIGLELGVISPALFAMMVMMALATTAMTTPFLQRLYPTSEMAVDVDTSAPGEFIALVSVALPRSGPGLLRVARALAPSDRPSRLYALHLQPSSNELVTDFEGPGLPKDEVALQPLLRAAEGEGIPVRSLAFVSQSLSEDIVDVARVKAADVVILGWHKPVVTQRILGGVVGDVLTLAKSDVAVYVERHFRTWQRILVPYRHGFHDDAALDAARRISSNIGVHVTVLHVLDENVDGPVPPLAVLADEQDRIQVQVVRSRDPVEAVVHEARTGSYDLVVIGVAPTWGLTPAFFGPRHERIVVETSASLLILRKHVPSTAIAVRSSVPVSRPKERDLRPPAAPAA